MNIKELEEYLENYDLVFIVNDSESFELTQLIVNEDIMAITGKKIMILTSIPFDILKDCVRIIKISNAEMKDIIDIYHTYEASDKITLLSEPFLYGGLQNYVRSELLSREEMIRAIIM